MLYPLNPYLGLSILFQGSICKHQNNTTCLKFLPSECTLGVSNICNANAYDVSSSNTRGVTAIIHRTVRCSTELSGVPSGAMATRANARLQRLQ
jgi:hypothetical protein